MFRDGFASITLLRQVVKHSPTGAMAPLSTPAVQALLDCSSSLRSALGKNALFALEESAAKQLVSHDAAVRMCCADRASNPRIVSLTRTCARRCPSAAAHTQLQCLPCSSKLGLPSHS